LIEFVHSRVEGGEDLIDGLTADRHHQVAQNLYALGGLLTGQLWETVAVPELRQQAAAIAARLTGGSESDS
jgi:uncharacterized NAD(P)/FAD-binding protein YdhS